MCQNCLLILNDTYSEEDVQDVDIQPVRGLQYVVTGTTYLFQGSFYMVVKYKDTCDISVIQLVMMIN